MAAALVSRRHELHHRVARRDSCVGPDDLNRGQLLVNLAHLNHSEPIDQMAQVLTGDGMEDFVRSSIDREKIAGCDIVRDSSVGGTGHPGCLRSCDLRSSDCHR